MEQITRRAARACFAILIGLFSPVLLQSDEALEYRVKAAFLLNFTKFIEWPAAAFASPQSPISICILGADPFGSTLDQIVAGEVVDGRTVEVAKIKREPPTRSCQVVFIDKSEKEVPGILRTLGPGILTVGDGATFVRDGGMIGFVIDNRHVRFDINQSAAEKAELKLSSKLLSVARAIQK